ncbi:MAG: pyridoxal phosphate-dependent aminotransferase family protein [Hydrogenimonas sp.]|nr:pyridoxal phosphate-dependent aminotransferase family protein [Hydrogenimonas sp.]
MKGLYTKELAALKRSGRFREPTTLNFKSVDAASNDYLGLAHKKGLFKRACKRVASYPYHAPKSSLFVGGYHPIHEEFITDLCEANGFEAGVVAGSGFLANLGMIEALVRRGDTLFIDESYHASGIMALGLVRGEVVKFAHNDPDDLLRKMAEREVKGRRVVAVEGLYSMEGDLLNREIFDIAEWFGALMIVDEAHSCATVGENLLGVFDLYGIEPSALHIKMGTLGKAYGSYGAYILASKEVISFLHNRAKPLIYATAPSLFDTALAHEAFRYINDKKLKLSKKIERLRDLVQKRLGFRPDGMIVPVAMPDIPTAIEIKEALAADGFEVGLIRPPTVEKPILRIILRTAVKRSCYRKLFDRVEELLHG